MSARLLVVAAALALVALTGGATRAATGGSCALWAAAFGNDGNPGTRESPFRSAAKLVATLRAGQTGCLEAGATFAERLTFSAGGRPSAPITLTSGPGPRATLARPVVVSPSAVNVRLYRLVLRGRPGQGEPLVAVRADRFALLSSDVDGASNAGPCVVVDRASDAVIDASTIHSCGLSGPGAPAISATNAWKLSVTNDFVFGNGGDGISLSPNAQRTLVSHDIVDGNDSGVYVGGSGAAASSNTKITQNVISNNARYGVYASYPSGSKVGGGNVVSRNCVWKAGLQPLAAAPPRALKPVKNLYVDPRFVDRSKGFGLRPGPCFAKRPVRYYADAQLVGGPAPVIRLPVMRSFTVRYQFRKAGSFLRLTQLQVVGVPPAANVVISCAHGCSIVERRRASSIGVASSTRFLGSFRIGSVIRVQATSPGLVGRYKLLVVGSGGIDVKPDPYAYCVGRFAPKNCQRRP